MSRQHAFWRITPPNRSTRLIMARFREAKKWRPAAILDFQLFWFSAHGTHDGQYLTLHIKFDEDRTYVSKVINICLFQRKCIEIAQKLGFWGILGVKTIKFIFLNPQRHILGPKHAFWRITRPNRSTRLIMARCRAAKKMASGGHLGFSTFLIFHYMAHIVVSIRLSISNLMKIGHTVQKLLAFVFSIGNALKLPKN